MMMMMVALDTCIAAYSFSIVWIGGGDIKISTASGDDLRLTSSTDPL